MVILPLMENILMTDIVFNTEAAAFPQFFEERPNGLTPRPAKCSGYGLGELIKDMKNPVGVEIGLAEGFTTEFLLESNETLKLYCIDPFENYIDWNGNNLNDRERVYNEFLQRTERFGDRVVLIRNYSDDAASMIKDNSLDFIFIDGLHTYDQVTKDMNNYYSKIKKGGLFAGHDYTVISDIHKAVDEYAAKKKKKVSETECDVWYWYK